MGAQSLVIGKMFGEGFQFGKRKISAMPNEEFNKLKFEDIMSNAREEIKASIPTMNAAMQDMKPMVDVVVREFFAYITIVAKIITGAGEGKNIFSDEGLQIGEALAHLLGTHHQPAHEAGFALEEPKEEFIGPPPPPPPPPPPFKLPPPPPPPSKQSQQCMQVNSFIKFLQSRLVTLFDKIKRRQQGLLQATTDKQRLALKAQIIAIKQEIKERTEQLVTANKKFQELGCKGNPGV